ncbi:hypothetical protein OJAV_G00082730 [Oryzias javanicus]|uniref:Uncharacterized protein n=1 Tax=Oryzias javanicus TaxID=123683 RepID=A0A3S2M8A3_ORYJA|nr:hypothetical protein OJAV_G00082730 [Oryzias javanicus]
MVFWRETELEMMKDIKEGADKLKLKLSDCIKSEGKGQAFKKYFSNTFTQTGKQYAELEKELEEVLSDTLGGKVVVQEGAALRSVPRVASDVPDIGQAAVKSSLALSKSARVMAIGVNALFPGMDIFFIYKDSISLSKGSETEVSQFIRARAALWSSEMDSWKKIYDSLSDGLQTSGKKEALLETPLYLNVKKSRGCPA